MQKKHVIYYMVLKMMNFKLKDDTPLLKIFIIYMVVCSVTIFSLKYITSVVYELSYDWIGCGEALDRANGSAAPRTSEEVNMYNECIFLGKRRWDK